tara:strand:- start:127 stop:252 length:126 start_codon:yes stop_codon:yes gene_type:complete
MSEEKLKLTVNNEEIAKLVKKYKKIKKHLKSNLNTVRRLDD